MINHIFAEFASTALMIVFGVGPAGTGKTYLAMAMAITAASASACSSSAACA